MAPFSDVPSNVPLKSRPSALVKWNIIVKLNLSPQIAADDCWLCRACPSTVPETVPSFSMVSSAMDPQAFRRRVGSFHFPVMSPSGIFRFFRFARLVFAVRPRKQLDFVFPSKRSPS